MLGRILFHIVIVGVLAMQLSGQQAGQIVGVVTDSTGGVVPGAAVKVVEVGTGFARTLVTGSAGGVRPARAAADAV